MDEKRKLIIFDRREIFLLFLFLILISITMFTLGLRIGKSITYKADGFTDEDRNKIEVLKSTQEESVDEILAKKSESDSATSTDHSKDLQEELNRLAKEQPNAETKEVKSASESKPTTMETGSAKNEASANAPTPNASTKPMAGKFTIQLGSHATLKEAEDFSDGFAVRGYNPIIHEVKIDGKGTWYRVSLGSFDTAAEAKDYIKKEESLFQGQDYIISEVK